jgi:hypothetical protein
MVCEAAGAQGPQLCARQAAPQVVVPRSGGGDLAARAGEPGVAGRGAAEPGVAGRWADGSSAATPRRVRGPAACACPPPATVGWLHDAVSFAGCSVWLPANLTQARASAPAPSLSPPHAGNSWPAPTPTSSRGTTACPGRLPSSVASTGWHPKPNVSALRAPGEADASADSSASVAAWPHTRHPWGRAAGRGQEGVRRAPRGGECASSALGGAPGGPRSAPLRRSAAPTM